MSTTDTSPQPALASSASRRGRIWLAVEFAVLFFGVPWVMTLAPLEGTIIPCLLAAFVLSLIYLLRTSGFDRRQLWNREPFVREARRFLPRFLLLGGLIGLCVWLFDPQELFSFPAGRPASGWR